MPYDERLNALAFVIEFAPFGVFACGARYLAQCRTPHLRTYIRRVTAYGFSIYANFHTFSCLDQYSTFDETANTHTHTLTHKGRINACCAIAVELMKTFIAPFDEILYVCRKNHKFLPLSPGGSRAHVRILWKFATLFHSIERILRRKFGTDTCEREEGKGGEKGQWRDSYVPIYLLKIKNLIILYWSQKIPDDFVGTHSTSLIDYPNCKKKKKNRYLFPKFYIHYVFLLFNSIFFFRENVLLWNFPRQRRENYVIRWWHLFGRRCVGEHLIELHILQDDINNFQEYFRQTLLNIRYHFVEE